MSTLLKKQKKSKTKQYVTNGLHSSSCSVIELNPKTEKKKKIIHIMSKRKKQNK